MFTALPEKEKETERRSQEFRKMKMMRKEGNQREGKKKGVACSFVPSGKRGGGKKAA